MDARPARQMCQIPQFPNSSAGKMRLKLRPGVWGYNKREVAMSAGLHHLHSVLHRHKTLAVTG